MDGKEKRNIMMSHYRNPKNKGFKDEVGYIMNHQNNESCIDNIDLEIKIDEYIIKDIIKLYTDIKIIYTVRLNPQYRILINQVYILIMSNHFNL